MKTTLWKVLTGSLLLAGLITTQISSASAATFYKCGSNFNFETNGDAARCYKPAGWSTHPVNTKCAAIHIPIINKSIGHFYRKNYQGNKDMCVGTFKVAGVTNTNTVEIGCPAGYSKQIRSGTDVCRKPTKAEVKAPGVRIQR